MSLLTDKDYLLHTLHLSYLRHVLPSHAPHSAAQGNSPYNLLSFPPAEQLAGQSIYLARKSRLIDEDRTPELATGRNSPPLALQLARNERGAGGGFAGGAGEADEAGQAGRRRRGPGQLGYSQTIGKYGSGGGRTRTMKGKGRLEEGEEEDGGGRGQEGGTAENGVNGFGPRQSRDAFLIPAHPSQPSLAPPPALSSPSSANPPIPSTSSRAPPNVVIHSPVRTPADSPVQSPHPLHAPAGPRSFADLQQQQPTTATGTVRPRRPRFATPSSIDALDPSSFDSPSDRHLPSVDPTNSSFPSSPASPSDFPSRPLAAAASATEASSAFPSPSPSSSLSSASSLSASPSPSPSPSPSVSGAPTPAPGSSSQPASSYFPHPSGAGASVASSGVSLYTPGALGIAPPPVLAPSQQVPPSPSPVAEESPAEEPAPPAVVAPLFQLPPGLRVRERRRVNLRPGMGLVSMPMPAIGEHGAPIVAGEAPRAGSEELRERERERTVSAPDPPAEEEKQKQQAAPVERDRKLSAPPTLSVNTSAQPSRSTSPTPAAALAPPPPLPASRPSSPSPRPRTPSSPALLFPPRSVYLRQPAPSPAASQPAKSALSALLAPSSSSPTGGAAGAPSNPFARLYSSLISRTAPPAPRARRGRFGAGAGGADADVLSLSLYFPHSSTPSKLLTLQLKRNLSGGITVEETIGAGLWAYWEEGREPGLEDGMGEEEKREMEERARRGEETARWNLRIVEDEGEVDEDFPALDRTRTITAFAFTEFAIVRATGQQVTDNLTKQSTLTRRPSRILSAPVPSAAPTPAPGAASSAQQAQQQSGPAKQLVTLRVAVPPGLTVVGEEGQRKEREGAVEVKVERGMYLSEVLNQILRRLIPSTTSPSALFTPPLLAKDYALLLRLSDSDLVLPLDRTVEASHLPTAEAPGGEGKSATGRKEVLLVERSRLGGVGLGLGVGRRGRQREKEGDEAFFNPPLTPSGTDDLDARRRPSSQQQRIPSATSTGIGGGGGGVPYQHYHVLRKLPMSLGGRHPRTIAIDGDYLHFMPLDPRFGGAPHAAPGAGTGHGALDGSTSGSGRTTSIHISAVHQCKVSRRLANSFKIVVHTPRNIDKRYDFEAESPEMAREVVERVREVMKMYGAGGREGQGGRLRKVRDAS
ncbi:hypothetical protein JCM8097_002264 [Rhodosporidiobolus ruineniae]